MSGISNQTGKELSGLAHLRQSITDILATPLGSRVMRRDYGSRLFELVDSPLNGNGIIEVYAATAEALHKWEKRLKLKRVWVDVISDTGRMSISLEGEYLPDGKSIKLDGIVL